MLLHVLLFFWFTILCLASFSRGTFDMEREDGTHFKCKIPAFTLNKVDERFVHNPTDDTIGWTWETTLIGQTLIHNHRCRLETSLRSSDMRHTSTNDNLSLDSSYSVWQPIIQHQIGYVKGGPIMFGDSYSFFVGDNEFKLRTHW